MQILGRSIDDSARKFYARRLQSGATRPLIVAEIASSEEATANVHLLHSRQLRKLLRRYALVRSLPLGNFRWTLLPSYGAPPVDPDFAWEVLAPDERSLMCQPVDQTPHVTTGTEAPIPHGGRVTFAPPATDAPASKASPGYNLAPPAMTAPPRLPRTTRATYVLLCRKVAHAHS